MGTAAGAAGHLEEVRRCGRPRYELGHRSDRRLIPAVSAAATACGGAGNLWDAATKASRSARRTRYLRPGRAPLPGRLALSAPDWIQVLTVSGMTLRSWATCSTVSSSSGLGSFFGGGPSWARMASSISSRRWRSSSRTTSLMSSRSAASMPRSRPVPFCLMSAKRQVHLPRDGRTTTTSSLFLSASSNPFFKRHSPAARDLGSDRLREHMQPSLGDLGLAGIERDDRGVDEREQLSARRPTCYIATRARFTTGLQRARCPAEIAAGPAC